MSNIITFQTFDNPISANIIKARLEENGVHCFLSDENMVTLYPIYNLAVGGIRLNIFEEDLEEANLILNEKENLPTAIEESEGSVICPKCGSTNVKYGAATKEKFSILTLFISIVLLVYPFKIQKIYHCFNCGNEFD
ncbi:MAG: DUF2007 domain-containing protein [Bacteroidia bacterium]